jgi:hypothetical protein
MSSADYRRAFPTRLSPQKLAVDDFHTTQGGFRMATSVGGALTGRGADFAIFAVSSGWQCIKMPEELVGSINQVYLHNAPFRFINEKWFASANFRPDTLEIFKESRDLQDKSHS